MHSDCQTIEKCQENRLKGAEFVREEVHFFVTPCRSFQRGTVGLCRSTGCKVTSCQSWRMILSLPCKNNGKCILENGQVKCKCSLPYVGSFCEHTRNPCQFSKCLNGGTCAPNEDFTDYTCLCQKDFKGLLCEKGIGECSKNLQ